MANPALGCRALERGVGVGTVPAAGAAAEPTAQEVGGGEDHSAAVFQREVAGACFAQVDAVAGVVCASERGVVDRTLAAGERVHGRVARTR